MAHAYARVLGLLALATVIARGLARGATVNDTLWVAILSLVACACLGAIAGRIAAWTVDQSVRAQLTAEIAAIAKVDPAPVAAKKS